MVAIFALGKMVAIFALGKIVAIFALGKIVAIFALGKMVHTIFALGKAFSKRESDQRLKRAAKGTKTA